MGVPLNIHVGATNQWEVFKVGGGGWVTGMDIAADPDNPNDATKTTIVLRCDTHGAFVGNGIDTWRQLVTASSMPSSELASYMLGTPLAKSNGDPLLCDGVYEIRIAPSNPDVLFAMIGGGTQYSPDGTNGRMWRSIDKGATWQRAGPSTFTNPGATNPNDADIDARTTSPHIAIDPVNPDVVYAGGRGDMYVTTNGMAADPDDITWTVISSSFTAPTSACGWTGMRFDPGSGTTDGRTNIVYVCSAGSAVYRGVWDGADTTWTALTNGTHPTGTYGGYVDADGNYWCVEVTSKAHIYKISRAGNVWTDYNAPGGGYDLKGALVDPSNTQHAWVLNGANSPMVSFTLDGGANWTGCGYTRGSGDTDWLANTWQSGLALGGQSMCLDPVTAGKIWVCDGTSVWYFTAPTTSGTVTIHAKADGIEQMVATDVKVSGNYVFVTQEDRSCLRVPRANTGPDPALNANGEHVSTISGGFAVDVSRLNSQHVAFIANQGPPYPVWSSGYSTDGGATWNETTNAGGEGGDIAVPNIDNILYVVGGGGDLVRSTNRGVSWDATVSGLPGGLCGLWTGVTPRHPLAVDAGYNGTSNRIIYCYAQGNGLYRSSDDGENWTNIGASVGQDAYRLHLRAVPGYTGHLFMSIGFTGSRASTNYHPWNNTPLRYCTGADSGNITWQNVVGFSDYDNGYGEPYEVALGAAAPGQSYPAIYVAGYRNYEWAIWRCSNFDPVNNTGDWTKLDNWPMSWRDVNGQPAGQLDLVHVMAAAPDVYGELYVGFQGSSWAKRNGD